MTDRERVWLQITTLPDAEQDQILGELMERRGMRMSVGILTEVFVVKASDVDSAAHSIECVLKGVE